MKNKRYLQNDIFNDALADQKMAFISGPRQIGKTYLAKQTYTSAFVYPPILAIFQGP